MVCLLLFVAGLFALIACISFACCKYEHGEYTIIPMKDGYWLRDEQGAWTFHKDKHVIDDILDHKDNSR